MTGRLETVTEPMALEPALRPTFQAPLSTAFTDGVEANAGRAPEIPKLVLPMLPMVLAPADSAGSEETATEPPPPPAAAANARCKPGPAAEVERGRTDRRDGGERRVRSDGEREPTACGNDIVRRRCSNARRPQAHIGRIRASVIDDHRRFRSAAPRSPMSSKPTAASHRRRQAQKPPTDAESVPVTGIGTPSAEPCTVTAVVALLPGAVSTAV